MERITHKAILTVASLVVSLGFNLNATKAATVNYDLAGEITTGDAAFIGETYSGTLSFDEVSGSVQSLTFNLLGSTFTEMDADVTPTVAFDGSNFLGVDYTVTVTDPGFAIDMFTLSTGFDLSDALLTIPPE